jgi:hypothetical protein
MRNYPCAPCVPPRSSDQDPNSRDAPGITLTTVGALSLAPPSQREGQLDEDADYQTAYQSARTVAVNGGRG